VVLLCHCRLVRFGLAAIGVRLGLGLAATGGWVGACGVRGWVRVRPMTRVSEVRVWVSCHCGSRRLGLG
jgi:hypothetical protein